MRYGETVNNESVYVSEVIAHEGSDWYTFVILHKESKRALLVDMTKKWLYTPEWKSMEEVFKDTNAALMEMVCYFARELDREKDGLVGRELQRNANGRR